METILSIVGGVFSGGATTLLGAVFGKFFQFLEAKEETKRMELRHKQNIETKRLDLEIASKEGENAIKLAEVEAAGMREVADAGAFGKSYDLEPKSFSATIPAPKRGFLHSFGWLILILLDVWRGVIRPGMTVYLTYIASDIMANAALSVERLAASDVTDATVFIYKEASLAMLRMFEFAVGWYFGHRPSKTK